jgi:hypothetical protein
VVGEVVGMAVGGVEELVVRGGVVVPVQTTPRTQPGAADEVLHPAKATPRTQAKANRWTRGFMAPRPGRELKPCRIG